MLTISYARRHLQLLLAEWLEKALGRKTLYNLQDRALRVLEEAVELAQAAGIPREKALEQLHHTYDREPGEVYQEIAGVLNAALLTAEAIGKDGMSLGATELIRVEEKIDLIRLKNLSKVQA